MVCFRISNSPAAHPRINPHPSANRIATPAPARAGFTFIELMMVIAVIAISAALVLPMIGGTDASRLRAAANMLASDLAYAQVESISHADNLRLMVFDIPNNRYRIAAAATSTVPITNPMDKKPYTTTFGQGRAGQLEGVSIYSYSLNGDDRVGFGVYGQIDQTSAATITLAAGTHRIAVSIDPVTGEPTIGNMY